MYSTVWDVMWIELNVHVDEVEIESSDENVTRGSLTINESRDSPVHRSNESNCKMKKKVKVVTISVQRKNWMIS